MRSLRSPASFLSTVAFFVFGLSSYADANSISNAETLAQFWPPPGEELTQLVIRCPTDRSICAISENGSPRARIAFANPLAQWSGGSTGAELAREEADKCFPKYAKTPIVYVVAHALFDPQGQQATKDSATLNFRGAYTVLDEDGGSVCNGLMSYSAIPVTMPKWPVRNTTLTPGECTSCDNDLATFFPVPTMYAYTGAVITGHASNRQVVATISGRDSPDYAVNILLEYKPSLEKTYRYEALSAFAVVASTP
jgi:hypothetical protein